MQDVPCTYRVSVKAIITDDARRVLLGREADDTWDFLGGGLEQGEGAKVALAREIAEEAGFAVEWMSEQPVAFWTLTRASASPAVKWFAFVAYEAKVSGTFQPSTGTNDAIQEIRYVNREEARRLKLHANVKPYFA